MSQQRFILLPWTQLILIPLVIFMAILAFFTYINIDKNLAYFLSHRPGGFPYAGSTSYEFWFHYFPKKISGTFLLAMIFIALLGTPFMTVLENIKFPLWQTIISYIAKTSLIRLIRRCSDKIPKKITITLWLTLLAIVFSSEMIGHLKRASNVYCPIRIQAYGGDINIPLSSVHEPFPTFAPNGGQCWPGGHSITGFIFEACFFGLYALGMRRAAWISLAIALTYGSFLGGIQVVRGQHYLSHQFWSGILCWYFSLMIFWIAEKYRNFKMAKTRSNQLAE